MRDDEHRHSALSINLVLGAIDVVPRPRLLAQDSGNELVSTPRLSTWCQNFPESTFSSAAEPSDLRSHRDCPEKHR